MEESTLEGYGGLDEGEVGEGVVGDVDGGERVVGKVRIEWGRTQGILILCITCVNLLGIG